MKLKQSKRQKSILAAIIASMLLFGCGDNSAGSDDTGESSSVEVSSDAGANLPERIDGDFQILHSAEKEKSWPIKTLEAASGLMGQDAPEFAVSSGAVGYKVVYRTVLEGDTILASGSISVPDVPGEYPVLSHQHGTITDDEDSPSGAMSGFYGSALNLTSGYGYITVMADFIGFAESNDVLHPYLVKEPTNQAVNDFLKAAAEFIEELPGYTASDSLFLIGYSQGGWATLAYLEKYDSLMQEQETSWELIAVSAGAGPTRLVEQQAWMLSQDSFPSSWMLAYTAAAYEEYVLEAPIVSGMMESKYADTIPGIFAADIESKTSIFSTRLDSWLTDEYLLGYDTAMVYAPLKEALEENSIDGFVLPVPLRLYHAEEDETVSYGVSESFVQIMKDAGNSAEMIQLLDVEAAGHGEAALPVLGKTITWFSQLRK